MTLGTKQNDHEDFKVGILENHLRDIRDRKKTSAKRKRLINICSNRASTISATLHPLFDIPGSRHSFISFNVKSRLSRVKARQYKSGHVPGA